ncbi:MAG: response regulator transcription factor [Lachnospiraceae bacterium]|nr:response regulator transcription factor [Lachnospiraceae bacterium]RKI29008.1 DNA-binding response regulator [bacterium D16-36]RKI69925.1 DNA-binding response regulator [bacterium 1xD8-6]
MGYRILVADDEEEIRELLRLYLEKEGYEVLEAVDGEQALHLLQEYGDVAMLILDIMMPKKDGFHVLKELREKSNLPVIILSAKTADNDKILGLDLGADDYIAKPFNPLEAVARINSNIRRFYSLGAKDSQMVKKVLEVQDLTLDLEGCVLRRGKEVIELSSTEYRLMELFMSNPGKIYTKQQIYEYGWQEAYFIADNNIMVCISKLRAKLSDDNNRYIRTVRGLGYRFEAGEDA